jgi:hypothetical protein
MSNEAETVSRFVELAKDARKTLRRWKNTGMIDLIGFKRGQVVAFLLCARSIKGYDTKATCKNGETKWVEYV